MVTQAQMKKALVARVQADLQVLDALFPPPSKLDRAELMEYISKIPKTAARVKRGKTLKPKTLSSRLKELQPLKLRQ